MNLIAEHQVAEHQVAEYMLPDMDSTFRLFAAHLRTVTMGWSYPRHSHPLFEVNLVLEGEQEMIVAGKRYVQKPGDFLLLPPEIVHETLSVRSEQMTYYCLHFNVDDRSLWEMLCRREDFLHLSDSKLVNLIRPCLDKLITLTTPDIDNRPADKMRTMSAVFELFAGLIDGLTMLEHPGSAGSRITKIASEIAAELERSVAVPDLWPDPGREAVREEDRIAERSRETVAAITAGFGYSPSSCNRIFRSVYGMSPRQYLSALKLKKAKLLLMEPDMTVEAVSMRLGYKDIAHFSRQFKRWTGESPGKFRGRFHL
ncbi:helix-turn-helix domain-containing protein [Paenibacillus brevis]|nr:AraC family transcriptional regulator [Paenibacillus brevis]